MASKAAKKGKEIKELSNARDYYQERLREQDVPEKAREKYRKDLEEITEQLLNAVKEWTKLTTRNQTTGGHTT